MSLSNSEPVAYINVEKRSLEWASPTRWLTPTVAKMDHVPLYTDPHSIDEAQIAEALRRHGLTLVKTAKGYDVINIGHIFAKMCGIEEKR